jgi:hypothetical protein
MEAMVECQARLLQNGRDVAELRSEDLQTSKPGCSFRFKTDRAFDQFDVWIIGEADFDVIGRVPRRRHRLACRKSPGRCADRVTRWWRSSVALANHPPVRSIHAGSPRSPGQRSRPLSIRASTTGLVSFRMSSFSSASAAISGMRSRAFCSCGWRGGMACLLLQEQIVSPEQPALCGSFGGGVRTCRMTSGGKAR